MHLRSKVTSEICQKVRSFDVKTKQIRLNSPTLPSFFSKKWVDLLKNGKRIPTFYCKNKCINKFYELTIKCVFRNMEESREF